MVGKAGLITPGDTEMPGLGAGVGLVFSCDDLTSCNSRLASLLLSGASLVLGSLWESSFLLVKRKHFE